MLPITKVELWNQMSPQTVLCQIDQPKRAIVLVSALRTPTYEMRPPPHPGECIDRINTGSFRQAVSVDWKIAIFSMSNMSSYCR